MFMDWRINIVNVTTLSEAIYSFSIIPIKTPKKFFTELEQIILKFVNIPKSQTNLEKEKQNWK